jgi:hypothetical protein
MASNPDRTAPTELATPPSLPALQKGLAIVLFVCATAFGVVALYPSLTGLALREGGWAYLTWGGILAAVSLVGGILILTTRNTPEKTQVGAIRNLAAGVLGALGIGFFVVFAVGGSKGLTLLVLTPHLLWCGALGLLGAGSAILLGVDPEGRGSALERLRLYLLGIGGIAGFLTTLLGFALPLLVYQEQITKGLESWRENPWALILPASALLGGLVLMFISLQLGRGLERSSVGLRRLIYGYNAVLTSLLLLAILALPNILAYASPFAQRFGRTFDFTASGFHELAPATRNLVVSIKEPTTVYLLLSSDDPVGQDASAMLEACRNLNDQITWKLIDFRQRTNRQLLETLLNDYPVADPPGILIVQGSKPNARAEFIRGDQLVQSQRPMPGERPQYTFTGEKAFVDALTFLSEGKVVIYFTQGTGEPDMAGVPRGKGMSLTRLRSRLGERKGMEIKELKFDANTRKVPDDANAVVVVRPTRPYTPAALDALRDYLRNRNGKLLALLPPVVQEEGGNRTLVQTGLEVLLRENGVQLGNDRLLAALAKRPLMVLGTTDENSTSEIARAFSPESRGNQINWVFEDVRSIIGVADRQGLSAQTLLVANPQLVVEAVGDLNIDPIAWAERVRGDKKKFLDLVEARPISIAVTVAESSGGGMPRDQAHAQLLKEKPRMVVFGTASWVSDDLLGTNLGMGNIDLFTTCLSWLRERPAAGQSVPDRTRKLYDLGVPETRQSRLFYLPLGLMLLGVIGLGAGVWVVRRR